MQLLGMDCKRCTYFRKVKNMMRGGSVIVGFCELREKHISDETINLELCKDRAVLTATEKEAPSPEENEEEFVKRAAFGG